MVPFGDEVRDAVAPAVFEVDEDEDDEGLVHLEDVEEVDVGDTVSVV